MGARFTAGSTPAFAPGVKNRQAAQVKEPPTGAGPKGGPRKGNTMQGMPGYIKTAQDKSSSGLANPAKARGKQNFGPRREGYLPTRKGESRKNWQSAEAGGGSMDKSYYKTSTDKPGKIRIMGEPKAPASRSSSEMETTPGRNHGTRSAISMGGATGANKLPAGGIKAGQFKGHIPDSLRGKGQGSANARPRASGGSAIDRVKPFGRSGTMESLAGKVKISKRMGMGKRSSSMMY